jgi:mono/diheme cytochrome c family protein
MDRKLAAFALLVALAAGCSRERAEERLDAEHQRRTTATTGTPAPAPLEQPPSFEDIARANAPPAALAPPEADWSGGDAARGHEVYELYCVMCHGADGRGDGPGAAATNPKPRDFTSGSFYIDANANNVAGEDIDLARVIRESPATFGGSKAMPAYKESLSEAQVRDLVAFIRGLGAHARARANQPPRSTSPGSAPVWTPSSSSTTPFTAHSA